jgi:hypothetical protein
MSTNPEQINQLALPEEEWPSAADLLPANPPNIPTTMAMQYRSAWREGVEDGWNEARTALAQQKAEGPSLAEIAELTQHHSSDLGDLRIGVAPEDVPALVAAAFARWGRPPAPPAPEVRESVRAAVAEALGRTYDCTRVWEAWQVGTMGPDDFSLVAEDDDRVAEIADAAIEAMRPTAPPALPPDYIDPEHQGEDLELLETFYRACAAEGGTADEIHLRGIRAVLAARAGEV